MDTSYISRTSGIKAKDKLGYAMGDFASLLVFGLVQSVLQKYYTDVLGIGVVSIMVMFIVATTFSIVVMVLVMIKFRQDISTFYDNI